MTPKQYSILLGLVLTLMHLTGCTGEISQSTLEPTPRTQNDTQSAFNHETITPTNNASPTFPPTTTSTNIALTPIHSPEPLPSPTSTPEQLRQNLTQLLEMNRNCLLPCWWGIVLGKSDMDTAGNMLLRTGFWWDDKWAGIGGEYAVFLEFGLENQIIQTIQISSSYATDAQEATVFQEDWQPYQLDRLLTQYGIPSQVFVYQPFRADEGSGSKYHLLVFYESLGIEIDYVGQAKESTNGQLQVCPSLNNVFSINLFLYLVEEITNPVRTVLPLESLSFMGGSDEVYEMISWKQATQTSINDFYERFNDLSAEECVDFSIRSS